MKTSREQLWPSIALLVVLAATVGYIVRAVAAREPTLPAVAMQGASSDAPETAATTAAAPASVPMPKKDPFAAPTPLAHGEAASPRAPTDGAAKPASATDAPSDAGEPDKEDPRPHLVGVVAGDRSVAVIRFGEGRYFVGVGGQIPGVGRVVEVARDSVVIQGQTGRLRIGLRGGNQ